MAPPLADVREASAWQSENGVAADRTERDMQYRLLVIDLDNTLFGADMQASARNREALQQAEAAGCRVAVCTARARYMTRPIVAGLGPISGPLIIFNGAARYPRFEADPDEVLAIDREALRACIQDAELTGMDLSGFEDPRRGDRVYVKRPAGGLREWAETNRKRVVVVEAIEDILEHDLVAFLCWGTEQQAWQARELLGRPEGFAPPRVAPAVQYDSYLLEMTAAGATKGEAVARLARDLGVPREAVIAIGDSDPDLGMIEFAGLGVAVANAKEHVRAAADYVAPPCNQDAVADVVERFILSER